MSAPCSACGVDFAFPALEGGLHGPKRGWGAGQAKAWGRMAARLRVERAYGFTYGDWCCPWCGAVVNDRWLFERGKEVQVTEGPPREGPWDVLF